MKPESTQRKRRAIWVCTSACPSRCAYCDIDSQKSHSEMSEERAVQVTQQLIDEGFHQINLVGGEPLLFKPLPAMMKTAHGQIDVALFTGGIPGDPRRWLKLCSKGVTRLVFSIDHGSDALNDRIRGRSGITQAVHKMAATFAQYRPDLDISISTVVSRYNINDVGSLWNRIRIYRPTAWALILAGENFESSPDDHMAKARQVERFYRKTVPDLYRLLKRSGSETQLITFPVPLPWLRAGIPMERWGDPPETLPNIDAEIQLYTEGRYNESFVHKYGCPLAGSDITIGADGALLPCSQAPIIKREFSVGSLIDQDLGSLLRGKKMDAFREQIPHAPCDKCWAPSNIEDSLFRQLIGADH